MNKTTAYDTWANGLIVRLHRTLKSGLRYHADGWVEYLPLILMGLGTIIKKDSGVFLSEMVFGRDANVR